VDPPKLNAGQQLVFSSELIHVTSVMMRFVRRRHIPVLELLYSTNYNEKIMDAVLIWYLVYIVPLIHTSEVITTQRDKIKN